MRRLLIYILAISVGLTVQALPLEQLVSVTGMTNNKINDIHRGHDGYMWFATMAGLCRYDGYDHDLYFINEKDGIPEGENDIDYIMEDFDGNLWLGSHSIYYVYNPYNDRIEHTADSLLNAYGASGSPRVVRSDSHRGLWVYTQNPSGIYYIDPVRRKARIVTTGDYPLFMKSEMTDFAETPFGVAIVAKSGDIFLVNSATRLVTGHVSGISAEMGKAPDMQYKLMYDRDGLLWVYTSERLWLYDLTQKRWLTDMLPSRGRNMVVKSVTQDEKGTVWIGRDHHGLEMVKKGPDSIEFINMLEGDNLLANSSVTSICDDGGGTLWVGTTKRGVFYYNDTMRKFTLAKGCDVNCLVPRPDGKVWVGSDSQGVGIFDPATQSFSFPFGGALGDGHYPAVTSMLQGDDGTLYIGSFSRGLRRIKNGKTIRIETGTALDSTFTWALAHGDNGDVWAGTLDSGLFRYSPTTDKITTYPSTESGLPSDCVITLAVTDNNKVYVGTAYGVGVLDKNTGKSEMLEGLEPGVVNDIMIDSRGLLWIASHRGIKVYDPQFRGIHDISFEQPKGATYVLGIKEDKDGSIWVAEGGRLINLQVEYNSSTGSLSTSDRSYDHRDGLQNSDFNQRSFALLPSGEMLVGGLYGINMFMPSKIRLNSILPRVMFTSLRVDREIVTPGEKIKGRVVLQGTINNTRKIELSHGVRDFTVYFSTDNYVMPDKTVYKYMLEGFKDTWAFTEPGVNHVTYTNLSPGKYNLLVRAVNNDGFESEDTATLEIVVHEPFYWTVWAKLLYILLFMVGVYCIYLLIRRNERRRFNEKRLADALKKEEELNQLKFRFITNVSHDLRTPLTLIMSPLDTMIREGGDERNMKRLELMRRNADQLLSMVNQLLDFRKSEVSGLTYKPSDGELVSFLRNVCSSFTGYSNKNIHMSFETQVKKLYMRFDEEKFYKVMMNLVSNAFKFTPNDGCVKVELSVPGDDKVVITVTDTGIGVCDEDKTKVFERFYQSSTTTADPSATGYGIGLSLVHDYVALHGGTVSVRDNVPNGAIFVVEIPIEKCLPDGRPKYKPESELPMMQPVNPIKTTRHSEKFKQNSLPTALVVDDNHDMLEFLKDGLGKDFHVVAVSSGEEAIKLLESLKPSIIVTDLMMPGIDGMELSRRVKGDPNLENIPVIVLSAKSGEDAKVEMFTLGVEDYITKPFNIELLILRMKRLVAITTTGRRSRLIDPEPESIPITPLDEKMVEKAVKYVVVHMKRPELSVEELSSYLGMSRVHLYKKLKATTGKTPIEFIRLIRLKRAAQLLRESQLNVSEVAYQVGFNSPRNFSKYFKDEFEMLPSAYQEAKEQPKMHQF